jgi:hypothetical protein
LPTFGYLIRLMLYTLGWVAVAAGMLWLHTLIGKGAMKAVVTASRVQKRRGGYTAGKQLKGGLSRELVAAAAGLAIFAL